MPIKNISNATITEISRDRGTLFVTITYREGPRNQQNEQTLLLVITPRTIILNTNGNPIPASRLSVGMTINAVVSSATTRSIPPQTNAYLIQITRRQSQDNITVGNILDIDRDNRSFTTISGRDFSSIIQFNVADNARILNRSGQPMRFQNLRPGMRVRVRHANFMTASIPPQTTAFEIQVL